MRDIWREQVCRHPSMEPQDVIKLCYQVAFGAEHLLEDREAAKAYFEREFDQAQSEVDEPLTEFIGNGMYRVNLGAWRKHRLPPEWLFRMFAETASSSPKDRKAKFAACVREAGELVAAGVFRFDKGNWEAYLQGYPLTEPVPVHHSESYRQGEKPAYRLVCEDFMQVPLLTVIAEKWKDRKRAGSANCVIAIDGPCASGKSTLARRLAKITGAAIVHMDDFFLPRELRSRERLEEPGGNVHYERFLEEVIPALTQGKDFSYRRFDCGSMKLGEKRQVCGTGIVLVEGSYSCHPKFGDYMDVRVLTDFADREQQLERVARREGAEAVEMFRQRWIPMEEAYFEACDLRKKADFFIRT